MTATDPKTWTRDEINDLLKTNDLAVERAVVALYNRQTADEQDCGDTKHDNGMGFDGASARIGTYCAKWVLDGKHLTGKYLDRCRAITIRHSRQLVDEANANESRNRKYAK